MSKSENSKDNLRRPVTMTKEEAMADLGKFMAGQLAAIRRSIPLAALRAVAQRVARMQPPTEGLLAMAFDAKELDCLKALLGLGLHTVELDGLNARPPGHLVTRTAL